MPLKLVGDSEDPLVNRSIIKIVTRAIKSLSELQKKETVQIRYDSRNMDYENTAGIKVDKNDL